MANYPSFLLTGKTPAATYTNVVQHVAVSSSLVDGLGNELTSSLNITASHAVSASLTNELLNDSASINKNGGILLMGGNLTVTDFTAEGAQATAQGSVAIGEGQAFGVGSLAQGFGTITIGTQSHAEGYVTTANGDYSHAEGEYTTALGICAHSEGQRTIASGSYQTVVGKYNTHGNTPDLFIIGGGTNDGSRKNILQVNQNRILVNADITASSLVLTNTQTYYDYPYYRNLGSIFRMDGTGGDGSGGPNAGTIVFRVQNSSDTTSMQTVGWMTADKDPNTAADYVGGQISVYVAHGNGGYNERIRLGKTNTRFVGLVIATDDDANVGGNGFSGSLTGSVYGTASYALTASYISSILNDSSSYLSGNVAIVTNITSNIINNGVDNSINIPITSSVVQGQSNIVVADFAHAEGIGNIVNGDWCHVEGSGSLAGYWWSHAEGESTITAAPGAHSEGHYSKASGDWSHAEGVLTIATTAGAHSEGSQVSASGGWSHAEGYQTITLDSYAHAEGYRTIASNVAAHSEGGTTLAAGQFSHAEGTSTVALGNYSHAGGQGTVASGTIQTVMGWYNTQGNTTDLFVIGGGTSDGSRKDILTTNFDGVTVSNITASAISVVTGSGQPTNSSSVAGWMPIQFAGQTYFLPLYQ